MAAEVTAALQGGTLQVTGTDNAEFVRVVQVGSSIRVSLAYAQPFRSFAANDVKSIQVNLNGGNDKLELNLPVKSLDALFVNMGRGSNESAYLTFGSAKSLNVNAIDSLHTTVFSTGVVNGVADINFGNDTGNDSLFIGQGATINNLRANMGGGDDFLQLHSSRIGQATINMGDGDDRFTNAWGSEVSSGSINGGTAIRGNKWTGARFGSAVRVSGF